MIENKLAKENIEGNCKRNIRNKKFKEKHKCDKSNFLTSCVIRRKKRFTMDGNPPRKGLMGGECPDEAQGCRVVGKK